jgi:hypothetical protein
MNIFHLSDSPVLSAQYQHDKHVVKMTLETAQLVSQAIRKRPDWWELCDDNIHLYQSTHIHHPSSVWTRATANNLRWLCAHGLALADEYSYRFYRDHKSRRIIQIAQDLCDKLPSDELTPFAMAMPVHYKTDDPVLSYRLYYLGEKIKDDSNWTRRRRDLPD